MSHIGLISVNGFRSLGAGWRIAPFARRRIPAEPVESFVALHRDRGKLPELFRGNIPIRLSKSREI